MTPLAPHEQLRHARTLAGEDLSALSARTGLRVHHARAIEEGRFADLPAGIYARSAIRSFAGAYTLDVDAVLAACEPLLPPLEDPINALARVRGLAPAAVARRGAEPAAIVSADAGWRPFAAATLDGAVAGVVLAAAVGVAALVARVSVTALSPSAFALFLLGMMLGSASYLWLGGLNGMTFGEYAVGPESRHRDPRPLTLRAITRRAIAASTADVRAIYDLGVETGSRLRPAAARNAPPTAPWPSPPRSRDREEVLTWSTSGRGSVPPPPLRPRRG